MSIHLQFTPHCIPITPPFFWPPTRNDIFFFYYFASGSSGLSHIATKVKWLLFIVRDFNLDHPTSLPGFPYELPHKVSWPTTIVHNSGESSCNLLEYKVAAKLIHWLRKHVNKVARSTLVKSVLTSIAVYFIDMLEIPMEVLIKIDSIRRAFI
jgi:hypothetical protein